MTIDQFKKAQQLVDVIEQLQSEIGELEDIIQQRQDPVEAVILNKFRINIPAAKLLEMATNRKNALQQKLNNLLTKLAQI